MKMLLNEAERALILQRRHEESLRKEGWNAAIDLVLKYLETATETSSTVMDEITEMKR